MRLVRGGIAVVLGAGALLATQPAAATPTPAPAPVAQVAACLPTQTGDYPPAPPVVDLEADLELGGGTLRPEVEGSLELTGAQAGLDYCAVLFSTPVTIPPTRAAAAGALELRPAVPLGFELAASHHLDVYRAERLVGSFDFCVDRAGAVVADQATGCEALTGSGGRSLVRTGLDHLVDLLRIAAVACAVGVFARYLRRRRLQGAALPEAPVRPRHPAAGRPRPGATAGRRPSGRSARGRPRA